MQPGDRGFLAAVLPQGKRAISIPITEVAGISGLVLPGDRVDIILTYSLIGADIDSVRDVRASETVMRNIRVLALDRRLHQAEAGADGRPQTDATPIARTATLQVSPREAEMITLATSLGDLSLVLNSVHDGGDEAESGAVGIAGDDSVSPRRMTLDSDVTSLLQNSGPEIAAPTSQVQRIQIVRGASAGAIELGEQALAAAAGLLSVLWLLLVRAPWPARAQWPALAVSALGTVVGFPLGLALALRDVHAAHAAVVTGVLPLATAVAGALVWRQRRNLYRESSFCSCGTALASPTPSLGCLPV